MDSNQAFPVPDIDVLKTAYVGRSLKEVPVPSAVLDVAKVRRNCKLMLDAVKELDLDFRAHVKTHKTTQLARLQVGEDSKDVRFIVSTLVELENLVPLLQDYRGNGATVNVLYGVPLGPSHIDRLVRFIGTVGEGSLTLMIDSPSQLCAVSKIHELSGHTVNVFLKTDSGYHRAGLPPTSNRMQDLVKAALALGNDRHLRLLGFYSHNSLSYGGNSPSEAMDNLRVEINACSEAAIANLPPNSLSSRAQPITISCGASPTALSLQNLLATDTASTTAANALRNSLANAESQKLCFEIHAGVYSTLDMQQVSASPCSALASHTSDTQYPEDSIALTILSEVCSTYPDRTAYPEALMNAGCLALAREPCKSYRGHGVVTSWSMPTDYDAYTTKSRMIVDRVSQEHGLLQWEDREGKKDELPVDYGQRVRIWPNHACITGAQFGWYLVVDSEDGESKDDVVVDVWVRWRGW